MAAAPICFLRSGLVPAVLAEPASCCGWKGGVRGMRREGVRGWGAGGGRGGWLLPEIHSVLYHAPREQLAELCLVPVLIPPYLYAGGQA